MIESIDLFLSLFEKIEWESFISVFEKIILTFLIKTILIYYFYNLLRKTKILKVNE